MHAPELSLGARASTGLWIIFQLILFKRESEPKGYQDSLNRRIDSGTVFRLHQSPIWEFSEGLVFDLLSTEYFLILILFHELLPFWFI
jgi:hypothetical protein